MNRNTPEDLVRELIHKGLNDSLACDDAYETGFATLHDKEGHPYVAHLDSGTGKEEKSDKKSKSEQDLTKAEISDYD